ncbi:MAG TPA: hypothetical protein VFP58_15050 [Candidatus Eisenbacteria bacterium]|nr:hypothetical protein [Candidatus Eisenbacteria bacterium]
MRSWQIRNILITIALAVWCGVATAGPESAEPPSTAKATATKKSPAAAKGTSVSTTAKPKTAAQAKTKKPPVTAKPATAAPKKAPAPEKASAPATPKPVRIAAPGKQRTVPHHVTGGGVGVLPRVDLPASTTPDVGLQGIKDRARWAPTDVCEDTDKKLQGTMRAVDKEASKNGDRLVMARIAAEFRVPPETVLAERARLSAPWGELLVAHTLLANARGVTVDQLFDMRAEGMGWGQIAWGLGFQQKDVTAAVQTEGKVIRGQSKPDGAPSKITTIEPHLAVDETAHSGGSSAPDAGGVKVETSVPEPIAK